MAFQIISRRVLASTTALAALITASAAYGQASATDAQASQEPAPSPPAPLSDASAGDIIVTANRRAERLNDVPLAISATSGEQLNRQNIVNLQSLRTIDPSLNYRVSTGSGSSAFSIRGIGTSSFSSGIEQSVSTLLDGVVLGDPSALQTLTDVERVEILRGPQGMLFGKNASSGVVAIYTNKPRFDKSEGIFRISLGENNERIAQVVLNAPLRDNLAVRVTGVYNHLGGWIYSPVLKDDLNAIDNSGVTGKVLWEPTPDISLLLSADYNFTNEFCCQQVLRSVPWAGSPSAIVNAKYGIVPSSRNFDIAADGRGAGFGRAGGASLTSDIKFGEYSWTTILSYRESHRQNFYDADFVDYNYVNYNGGDTRNRNFSGETRIASPVGGFADFVAGLFYYHSKNDGLIGSTGYFPNSPNLAPATLPVGSILQTSASRAVVKNNNYAAFGQVNFHLARGLELSLGGRYTVDRLGLVYTSGSLLDPSLPLRFGYPATGIPSVGYVGFDGPYVTPCVRATVLPARPNCFDAIRQSNDAENFSYRASLKYEFLPDIMAYVTYARGYKGPGFSGLSITPSNIINGTADQRVAPEIPHSIEIGAKGDLFDRKLSFNIAVFRTRYENFQAQVSTPQNGQFVSRIANAGQVTVKGIEFGVSIHPVRDVSFDFGGTYLKARFGDFPGVSCYSIYAPTLANPAATVPQPGCVGGLINVRGNKVDNAPEFQYYIRAAWEPKELFGSFTGFVNADWSHRSSVFYSATNNPLTFQEGYGLLGGQIGIGADDNGWRVSLYGSNILNKIWAANLSASPTPAINPGGSIQFFSPDSFRHVGIKLEARF
ncbi:TonB-dependent receptor [Sphingomonas sp. So64.6b]|uniref:TonB-dependent receptor n=1 Tax=Sphingomonas sp. So64.6b TaxID=2997354 RepID=UPI0015FF1627|nr:TonB-dependent receptor [Sphingomonas sp. So64.6b]QNA86325.1 TonB-dependent receptor [Sphingomonas sp. So64.6b]